MNPLDKKPFNTPPEISTNSRENSPSRGESKLSWLSGYVLRLFQTVGISSPDTDSDSDLTNRAKLSEEKTILQENTIVTNEKENTQDQKEDIINEIKSNNFQPEKHKNLKKLLTDIINDFNKEYWSKSAYTYGLKESEILILLNNLENESEELSNSDKNILLSLNNTLLTLFGYNQAIVKKNMHFNWKRRKGIFKGQPFFI